MIEWDGIWHESEVYLSANGACQRTGERLPGGFSAAPLLPTLRQHQLFTTTALTSPLMAIHPWTEYPFCPLPLIQGFVGFFFTVNKGVGLASTLVGTTTIERSVWSQSTSGCHNRVGLYSMIHTWPWASPLKLNSIGSLQHTTCDILNTIH